MPVDDSFVQGETNDDMFSFSVKALRDSTAQDTPRKQFADCQTVICRKDDKSDRCCFNKKTDGRTVRRVASDESKELKEDEAVQVTAEILNL